MQQEYFRQLAHIIPNVSHETFADLCAYEALLRKWQPHINLIANSTLDRFWHRHILDSAQLFPLQKGAENWLDLGSGGGFPALVIACLLKQYNRETGQKAHINLVESNGKKAAFLRQIIQNLSLPASLYQSRIEDSIASLSVPDILTARALASLDKLFALSAPLFAKAPAKHKITALIQKGRDFAQEIATAKQHWSFNVDIKQSLIDANSVILLIRNLTPR